MPEKTKIYDLSKGVRLSVAPMMDWTDRYCRKFHRLISRDALLYTEMVTTGAIIYGDRDKLLGFDPCEHPVACQLGGSNPADLAAAARVAQEYGYDEINLNVGCPSDRVQSGRFGACLMQEPELVAACVGEMKAAVSIPVTVKCRIGVDEQDPEQALDALADAVLKTGCDALWVHARKAWLKGLSPKENRDVPPLDYQRVYRLKQRLPQVYVGLNGGVVDMEQAAEHLRHVDGVMLGRAAYHNPWILSQADALSAAPEGRAEGEGAQMKSRVDIVHDYLPFIEDQLARGVKLSYMTRHILGLFQSVPGARTWRRHLTVEAVKPGAGVEVVLAALEAVAPIENESASAQAAE